jgi:hypothetical protein
MPNPGQLTLKTLLDLSQFVGEARSASRFCPMSLLITGVSDGRTASALDLGGSRSRSAANAAAADASDPPLSRRRS